MLIAIDYDKTWTTDPGFWSQFVASARQFGHSVVMVTGRRPSMPVPIVGIPVVYTSNEMKRKAATAAGYSVDVWIDDTPETIGQCIVLDWSES